MAVPNTTRWRKVRRLRVWIPQEGEALIGTFSKARTLKGAFGEYRAFDILGDDGGRYRITGADAANAFEDIQPGMRVQIICAACEEFAAGDGNVRVRRTWDLYIEDEEDTP